MHYPAAVRGKYLEACALLSLLAALQEHSMGTHGRHAARVYLQTSVFAPVDHAPVMAVVAGGPRAPTLVLRHAHR